MTRGRPKRAPPRDEGSHSRSNGEVDVQMTAALLARVVEIRDRIGDCSPDPSNVERIVALLPEEHVEACLDLLAGAVKDGKALNPPAYFVGIAKARARDLGIELGLPGPAP